MTAHAPLVSIVTPSYNQAPFLEETLRSVQRQDYPRIEHLVIDGGSTDGSVEILRRHRHKVWTNVPGATAIEDGQAVRQIIPETPTRYFRLWKAP